MRDTLESFYTEQPGVARSVPWLLLAAMAAVLQLTSCSKMHKADPTPLDKAGVWFQDIQPFRDLNVTDAEVQEMVNARQGGISEQACLELIRIARDRKQPFVDGYEASNLLAAGMQETSVLELARLNQLGLQTGEAQALSLAHLSDQVILAIAQRRATGLPTLSGPTAAALQNSGFSEQEILTEINRGTTDAEANAMIAHRNAAPKRFIRHPRPPVAPAALSAWGR